VSDVLAYWRYDNYKKDIAEGAGFNFNSNQQRLHSLLDEGDSLWLVTGRSEAGRNRRAYYVVARLVIRSKTLNAPDYKYGKYRAWGDLETSKYYQVGTQEASEILRNLPFASNQKIGDKEAEIAQHLQTMRMLSQEATSLLEVWCAKLPIEEAAYQILPEEQLERAIEQDAEAVRKLIRETSTGIAEYRLDHLVQQPIRSRSLIRQIHELYEGRCQVCGFDPLLIYGVEASHAHHLVYLSRGGADTLQNMTLLCPNHHSVIHATNAVFDYGDLSFVFAPNHRERLALNRHLHFNT